MASGWRARRPPVSSEFSGPGSGSRFSVWPAGGAPGGHQFGTSRSVRERSGSVRELSGVLQSSLELPGPLYRAPVGSLELSGAPWSLLELPGGSRARRLPEAPRVSQRRPKAPGGSQRLPEAPRSPQKLQEARRSSQKLPEAPRGSQRLPEPRPQPGQGRGVSALQLRSSCSG